MEKGNGKGLAKEKGKGLAKEKGEGPAKGKGLAKGKGEGLAKEKRKIISSSSSSEGDDHHYVHFDQTPPPPAKNIDIYYCPVSGETRWFVLEWLLAEKLPSSKVIVLFGNRHSVRFYRSLLVAEGVAALSLHKGQKPQAKKRHLEEFQEKEDAKMLCTSLGQVSQTPGGAANWFVQFDPPSGAQEFLVNADLAGASKALIFLRKPETAFLDLLARPSKHFKIPAGVMGRYGMQVLVKPNSKDEETAKKACLAYLKSYQSHKIFNFQNLDHKEVAGSFGIPRFAKEMRGIF